MKWGFPVGSWLEVLNLNQPRCLADSSDPNFADMITPNTILSSTALPLSILPYLYVFTNGKHDETK